MTTRKPKTATPARAERNPVDVSTALKIEGLAGPVTVRVCNISNGGMMVEGDADFVPGQRVHTTLSGIGPVRGRIAWTEAGRVGIAFENAA